MLVKKGDELVSVYDYSIRYKVICADEEFAVLCSLYETIMGNWVSGQIAGGKCRVIDNDESRYTLEDQDLRLKGGTK